MTQWWEALTTFEKVLWFIAIPFSFILVIQMILTFTGMGGEDTDIGPGDVSGGDLDLSSDAVTDSGSATHSAGDAMGSDVAFNFFTIRNFIAFFTLFGWAGIAAYNGGLSKFWTIIIAVVAGIIAMAIVSMLFYFLNKLQDSGGALNIRNAINQVGDVYLPIKANNGNVGKIQINVQGAVREMQAITKGDKDLPTGTVIKVTGVASDHILVVEKMKVN